MTTIAQLSDIHFGSETDGAAEQLLEALNAASFDLVVLSGDLTMAARRAEFQKAADFIRRLNAPTLSVPGNHDITPYRLAQRFLAPYKRWRHYISETLEPSWRDDNVAVVGINTARRMRLRLDWSHGSISRRQMKALPERFDSLGPAPFRIVVAHHPFLEEMTDDLGDRPRVMVKRAREALSLFSSERVDLVLAGHLHRTYATAFKGVPGAERAQVQHPVTTVQAGTALSARTRGEPNSFNRIDIGDGRLTVRPVRLGDSGWTTDPSPIVDIEAVPHHSAA